MTASETVQAASAELDRQLSRPADLCWAYSSSPMAERINNGYGCYYLTSIRETRLATRQAFATTAEAHQWADENGYTIRPHSFPASN
jgi:hypothetical protein